MRLNEVDKPITQAEIDQLEVFADRLFAKVGIDVEFTRHFLDRVNDERNVRQITMSELTRLFKQEFKRWGKKIAQLGPDAEAVMKDLATDVNMPFALRWDEKNKELDLIAKTVMRKQNFRTSNPEFAVEAATAQSGVFGTGLDPAQFQQKYGVSPKTATQSIGKVVRLHPNFNSPRFQNALTQYMLDNPKSMQAANDNAKVRLPKGSNWLKWGATRALGVIGMILTPSELGDGSVGNDRQTLDSFINHLIKTDPQLYVDFIDAEIKATDPRDLESYDPRSNPQYQDALNRIAGGYTPPVMNPPQELDSITSVPSKDDSKQGNKIGSLPVPTTTVTRPEVDTDSGSQEVPQPLPFTVSPQIDTPANTDKPADKPAPITKPKPANKPADLPEPGTAPTKPKVKPKVKPPEVTPGVKPLSQPDTTTPPTKPTPITKTDPIKLPGTLSNPDVGTAPDISTVPVTKVKVKPKKIDTKNKKRRKRDWDSSQDDLPYDDPLQRWQRKYGMFENTKLGAYLFESGSMEGVGLIHRDEIKPTLAALEKDLKLSLSDFTLGSVGKKDFSGDIDVAINLKPEELPAFMEKLKKSPLILNVNKPIETIITKLKIVNYDDTKQPENDNRPRTGYVQLDFMPGDPGWLKTYYHSPSDKESKYKGVFRNILIAEICAYYNRQESDQKLEDGRAMETIRYKWSPTDGLVKVRRTPVMNKKGTAYTKKNQDEIIEGPWKQAAEIAQELNLGDVANLNSFESLLAAIEKNYTAEVVARIKNGFKNNYQVKDIGIPQELQ